MRLLRPEVQAGQFSSRWEQIKQFDLFRGDDPSVTATARSNKVVSTPMSVD